MAAATIALLLPAALKNTPVTSASAAASVRSPSSELAGWRLASRFASGCAPGGVPRRRSTLRDGLPLARRLAETETRIRSQNLIRTSLKKDQTARRLHPVQVCRGIANLGKLKRNTMILGR